MNNGLLGFPRGTGAGIAGSGIQPPVFITQTGPYVIPEDGYYVLKAQGAGAGGGATSGSDGGNGGGAGAEERWEGFLPAGTSVSVTVGAPGTGHVFGGAAATNGGNTIITVSVPSLNIWVRIVGEGGLQANTVNVQGRGGSRVGNNGATAGQAAAGIPSNYTEGGRGGNGGVGANSGQSGNAQGNAWAFLQNGSAQGGAATSVGGGGAGGDSPNGPGATGATPSVGAAVAGQSPSLGYGGGGSGASGGTTGQNGGAGRQGCGIMQRIA